MFYGCRYLSVDGCGWRSSKALTQALGNNPLGYTDPSGLYSMSVRIPTDCVTDNPGASTAYKEVTDWLYDVGFGDDYQRWYIEYIDIDGAYFDISLTDGSDITDVCDVKVPKFEFVHVGGIQVVVIDGIGRLDSGDRTLNRIIGASVHRVNQWWRYGSWTVNLAMHQGDLRGKNTDTPFQKSTVVNWKYKGMKFDRSEVNYILEGHAMARLGIPYDFGQNVLVSGWKNLRWGHAPSGKTLYWFEKGYNEYESRKTW